MKADRKYYWKDVDDHIKTLGQSGGLGIGDIRQAYIDVADTSYGAVRILGALCDSYTAADLIRMTELILAVERLKRTDRTDDTNS